MAIFFSFIFTFFEYTGYTKFLDMFTNYRKINNLKDGDIRDEADIKEDFRLLYNKLFRIKQSNAVEKYYSKQFKFEINKSLISKNIGFRLPSSDYTIKEGFKDLKNSTKESLKFHTIKNIREFYKSSKFNQ